MSFTRRRWLQRVLALLSGLSVGWCRSSRADDASELSIALRSLFGQTEFPRSDRIHVTAPALAEDGSVVPMTIAADLSGVTAITIVAEHNPAPVVARFRMSPPLRPKLTTRIKLAETTDLRVLVTTHAGTFEARTLVRVVQGGCDTMPDAA